MTSLVPSLPILVVDDSTAMRQVVREILLSCGMLNVLTAADGAEALARFREATPAVILLDWVMPHLNGPGFLKLLRTECGAPGRTAQVLIVTASPTQAMVEEARRWRVDAIIRKPFTARTLIQRLEFALRAWKATRPEWEQPDIASPAPGGGYSSGIGLNGPVRI